MVYKNRVDGKMPINSIYRTAAFLLGVILLVQQIQIYHYQKLI